MPTVFFGQEWLDQNGQRAFPLAPGASRTDTTGTFQIPNSLLLALYLPVHAGLDVEAEKVFLRELVLTGSGLSLVLAYDDGGPTPVAGSSLALATHTEYQSYAVAGIGEFDDVVGKVVIGDLSDLTRLPPGRYLFDAAAGALDPDCVRPQIRGVSSIVLVNGAERSARLTGDVELTAGTNTRLTVIQSTGAVPKVRIDAIAGEGLSSTCACEDDPGPCVRTINGVAPSGAGDFTLSAQDCMAITPETNGLLLANACAKPCCGCAELAVVTTDLAALKEAAATLAGTVSRLSAETSQMNLTVLGSRLGDRGCSS